MIELPQITEKFANNIAFDYLGWWIHVAKTCPGTIFFVLQSTNLCEAKVVCIFSSIPIR